MPLPAGVRLNTAVHPEASWPPDRATPLVAPPLGQGKTHPARVARDRTRWCAYGDHTLDPDSRIRRCDSCAAFRDGIRKNPVGDAFRYLPTEVVYGLIAAARDCDVLVNRLHAKFLVNQDLTTKELADLFNAASNTNAIAALAEEYLDTPV